MWFTSALYEASQNVWSDIIWIAHYKCRTKYLFTVLRQGSSTFLAMLNWASRNTVHVQQNWANTSFSWIAFNAADLLEWFYSDSPPGSLRMLKWSLTTPVPAACSLQHCRGQECCPTCRGQLLPQECFLLWLTPSRCPWAGAGQEATPGPSAGGGDQPRTLGFAQNCLNALCLVKLIAVF